jgi:hypothetical protein
MLCSTSCVAPSFRRLPRSKESTLSCTAQAASSPARGIDNWGICGIIPVNASSAKLLDTGSHMVVELSDHSL